MKQHTEINNKDKAEIIDTFIKFCYCFPLDIEEKFKDTFGESMGDHFYKKFKGYCERKETTFTAMIYTVGDMTNNNKKLFMDMVEKHYNKS